MDAVVLGRFLDIRERQFAIFAGDAFDLIEACYRVPDVARVGERLFALVREGKDALRQVASGRQIAVFGVGLPSGLYGHVLFPLWFCKIARDLRSNRLIRHLVPPLLKKTAFASKRILMPTSFPANPTTGDARWE
jgi:hypothetical protein